MPTHISVQNAQDYVPVKSPSGDIQNLLVSDPKYLLDVLTELRDRHGFGMLSLVNVVEYKQTKQVIYQLQKISDTIQAREHGHDIFEVVHVSVNVPASHPSLPTVTKLWHSADWFEREMFDMHGVQFTGHPNLTRILNPDGWVGHPMTKDYIPPLDELNAPITAVKGNNMGYINYSVRRKDPVQH